MRVRENVSARACVIERARSREIKSACACVYEPECTCVIERGRGSLLKHL